MTREQFIRICFVVLLVFVVYQVFRIFSPFAETVFWAAILTFAFYPFYQFVNQKLKVRRSLASMITTFVILLIVILPVTYLIVTMASQGIHFYQVVYDYVREGRLNELIDEVRNWDVIQKLQVQLHIDIDVWELFKNNAANWLLRSSRSVGNFAAIQLGAITKNLVFILMNFFFLLTLIFIFLQDGDAIYRFIYHNAPLEEKNKGPLFTQVNETFAAVIRGQLLTAVSQAIVAGIIFWALGIPAPIIFGAATFFTSLIPVIGAAAIWTPWCVYFFMTHQTAKGVILLLCGVLIISLLDNLVKPAVIGEKTKLPYFLLFFGILGGLQIYGFTGIFLAPVVLSLFFALIRIYQEKNW